MIEGLEAPTRGMTFTAIACGGLRITRRENNPFNRVSAVEARDKHMVAKRPRWAETQSMGARFNMVCSSTGRTARPSAQQFPERATAAEAPVPPRPLALQRLW